MPRISDDASHESDDPTISVDEVGAPSPKPLPMIYRDSAETWSKDIRTTTSEDNLRSNPSFWDLDQGPIAMRQRNVERYTLIDPPIRTCPGH